ncbi:MAG: hypothetical protein ACP5NP_17680, partial [Acetobacteraceae bacterium]
MAIDHRTADATLNAEPADEAASLLAALEGAALLLEADGSLGLVTAEAARLLGRERDLPRSARLGGGAAFAARPPGGAWRGFPAGLLVL